jgi:hypothetical protein
MGKGPVLHFKLVVYRWLLAAVWLDLESKVFESFDAPDCLRCSRPFNLIRRIVKSYVHAEIKRFYIATSRGGYQCESRKCARRLTECVGIKFRHINVESEPGGKRSMRWKLWHEENGDEESFVPCQVIRERVKGNQEQDLYEGDHEASLNDKLDQRFQHFLRAADDEHLIPQGARQLVGRNESTHESMPVEDHFRNVLMAMVAKMSVKAPKPFANPKKVLRKE